MKIRWTWHVAPMGERKYVQHFLWLGKLKEKNNVENQDIEGRIILKFIC